jgi:hypothetical protein
MVEAMGFSTIKAWEPGWTAIVVGGHDLRRSDGKVYQARDRRRRNRTGSIQPTHTRGAEWDGSGGTIARHHERAPTASSGISLRRFGVGTITAIGGGGTTRRSPSPAAWPTA